MKGLILNEFVAYAETAFRVATKGPSSWNANGRYDPATLMALVADVGAANDVPTSEVLRQFGRHLFHRFAALYPAFFVDGESCLDFLTDLDTLHVEVQKLYPDAQFPSFTSTRAGKDRLQLTYRSELGLADFAEGLLRGCIAYFDEPITLDRADPPDGGGRIAEFFLERTARARPPRRA